MTADQRQQWKARWRKLAVMFVSACVTLVGLEAAVRIRQYIKYGSMRNTVFKTTVDPKSGLAVPVPGQITRSIRINSRGFRSPELAVPKPAGRIRLAFLGASTTFCAEVSGNEATWPYLVWKKLQSTWPESAFDFVNAGVPGYTVAESLLNLEYRVAPLQPDVIIIYHASNDLTLDTRELAMKQGLIAGKPGDPSKLARMSLLWYLVEKNLQIMARKNAAAAAGGHLVFDPPTLSLGFREKLRGLVEVSQKTASVVALATFSHRARRDQSREEQSQACLSSFYYMPYMSTEGILAGYEKYNDRIREVAHETGAILIGGEDKIPGDAIHFNDSVHFKDAGSELMARRVANALTQSTAFRSLVASRQHELQRH